jgi:predicted acylesterase/phospholipase RssA
MIKNFVLSGGGIWGFSCYGALRESCKSNFWNIQNIESIYATSSGSMLSVMLALKYDWETLDNFLIKRPWSQVFKFDISSIFSAVEKRGIFDKKCIYDLFEPLFKGKDLSMNMTMKEFYELNKIDLHFFSTEINHKKFEKIDFSWKTHPDWKLLDVVYCSSCLPILFSPFLTEEGDCYIDGGILNNYPVIHCQNAIEDHDTIFGIIKTNFEKQKVESKSTLFDYLLYFISKIINNIEKGQEYIPLKNELQIMADATNLYDVYMTSSSMDERIKLIDYGVEAWKNSRSKNLYYTDRKEK